MEVISNTTNYCHQFLMRVNNYESDVKKLNICSKKLISLKVSDFDFQFVPKEDAERCNEIKSFITKHEWLGTMPQLPTHRFIATYKGELAGVVVMSIPNAFSFILGKENRDKEKLVSRGACISWSPKNLASALIMYSIRWMVKNTQFRYFTAYSDTEAGELGTIYQACNFIYLGKRSGAKHIYFDPFNPEMDWFTDREFRRLRSYKRYAKELGVQFQKSWNIKSKILWHKMPPELAQAIKDKSIEHKNRCIRKRIARKHKYVYLLGTNKKETKSLHKVFRELNSDHVNLNYPKVRGQ